MPCRCPDSLYEPDLIVALITVPKELPPRGRCQSCFVEWNVRTLATAPGGGDGGRGGAFQSLGPEGEDRAIVNCLALHSYFSQPQFLFCSAGLELGHRASRVPVGESAVRVGRAGAEGPPFTGEQSWCLGILQRERLSPSYDPPSILQPRTHMLNYGSCQC